MGRFALDGTAVYAVALGIAGSPLEGNGIATDVEGNAYVVGTLNEGGEDKEVLYLKVDGSAQLVYAYFVPHAGEDQGPDGGPAELGVGVLRVHVSPCSR